MCFPTVGCKRFRCAEVLFQIIDVGEQLDYEQCILVSRKASLNETLPPIALVHFYRISHIFHMEMDRRHYFSCPAHPAVTFHNLPRVRSTRKFDLSGVEVEGPFRSEHCCGSFIVGFITSSLAPFFEG